MTYNILIVEDDESVSKVMEDLIHSHDAGVRVDTATSLEEAEGHLVENGYDAVLLDFGLPDSELLGDKWQSLDDGPDA